MAKKIRRKPVQISSVLKFKIDWIKDPVPYFRKYLNQTEMKRIKQAKVAFGKKIDSIVKSRSGKY